MKRLAREHAMATESAGRPGFILALCRAATVIALSRVGCVGCADMLAQPVQQPQPAEPVPATQPVAMQPIIMQPVAQPTSAPSGPATEAPPTEDPPTEPPGPLAAEEHRPAGAKPPDAWRLQIAPFVWAP